MRIPSASQLKYSHEQAWPDTYFFSRKTMKFFGDTMKNYKVSDGDKFWILSRRQPVKFGMNSSYHFDKVTFKRCSLTNIFNAVE